MELQVRLTYLAIAICSVVITTQEFQNCDELTSVYDLHIAFLIGITNYSSRAFYWCMLLGNQFIATSHFA